MLRRPAVGPVHQLPGRRARRSPCTD